jgi:IS30 family transposase
MVLHMGIKYSQLTEQDRSYIEVFLHLGASPAGVARYIGCHRSTVCRERDRGLCPRLGRYLAVFGQRSRDQRRRAAGLARRKLGHDLTSPAWQGVVSRLRAGFSPEQICLRMRTLDPLRGCHFLPRPSSWLSHETIYKGIYDLPRGLERTSLVKLLRRSHSGRRRRSRGKARFTGLQNMTPISQRPAEVFSRLVPGHWEGDLIKGAGGASCIGTLVERSSRLLLLVKLDNAGALACFNGFSRRLRRVPAALRKSLTYDQGTEMALHERLAQRLNMPIFFCDPHSPWQRPTNENTNGLLRQYLPKGLDLSTITQSQLSCIEVALNNRPRRVLCGRTPQEVFDLAMADVCL